MRARELVVALAATPREAGTPEAEAARGQVAAFLISLGYQVEVQRFRFSTGTLNAFPILGAGLGWLAVVELPLLLLPRVPSWVALVVLGLGAAALATVVAGVALGWAASGESREDANLVAVRGPAVRRWIVAHLDSKAQGHSMAGRLVAVWVTAVAALGLVALAITRLFGPVSPAAAAAGAAAAMVAGFLAGRGRLRGRSPGARDNATGLLAVLEAAEASDDPALGVLVTGAEEFGLVGARIFAQERPAALHGAEVVNCDTLDDEGLLFLVAHDDAGSRLARRLEPRLAPIGVPLRHRRLPLGIFVDSHPLAAAGAAAVTVGRLTWATLRRLHTPRDEPGGLTWETAERVGRALARSD